MAKDIHVLLFTDTLCDINGVSRFIQDIAQIAHAKKLALYVVTSSVKECPQLSNINIIKPLWRTKIPFYPEYDLAFVSFDALNALVDEIKPDAIHISTPGFIGWMGRRIGKKRSIPIIGTYHTDFPNFAYKNIPLKMVKYLSEMIMHHFYSNFQVIFVRSEAYRQIVKNDIGLAPERIITLTAGIDNQKFHVKYKDQAIWEVYGIPKDALKVLYVGRFSKEKNFPLLLKLWKLYFEQSKNKNIYLILVGGEVDTTWFEMHHIRSLGTKRGVELSHIYASSDLFLFPSTTDTLGQVVMEAMSSGLPVIVSDTGGPSTLIRDEQRAGYALSTDDDKIWLETLKMLLEDQNLRAKLGENGQQIIAQMGIEKSFERFWEVHKEFVSHSTA